MNFLPILISIALFTVSACLFYKSKTKRKRIEFTHEESNKSWVVLKTNYWIILKSQIQNNLISTVVILILITVLIILSQYYFLGEFGLGATFAILLAALGAIGASLLTGSDASGEEITSGTESFFRIVKQTVEEIKRVFAKESDESVTYSGYIEMPSKIYVDESDSITINLFRKASSTKSDREYVEYSQNEEIKLVDIQISRKIKAVDFLRVELQAASLKVSGEAKQQIGLLNNHIKFQWTVSSEKPTLHKTVLIFTKVSDSLIKHLGETEHSIKVVNLFGLTRRQVFIGGAISGLSGLIPIIRMIIG